MESATSDVSQFPELARRDRQTRTQFAVTIGLILATKVPHHIRLHMVAHPAELRRYCQQNLEGHALRDEDLGRIVRIVRQITLEPDRTLTAHQLETL